MALPLACRLLRGGFGRGGGFRGNGLIRVTVAGRACFDFRIESRFSVCRRRGCGFRLGGFLQLAFGGRSDAVAELLLVVAGAAADLGGGIIDDGEDGMVCDAFTLMQKSSMSSPSRKPHMIAFPAGLLPVRSISKNARPRIIKV